MSIGDLAFDFPPTLNLTWSIPDFLRLATGSEWSLQCPDFPFVGGRYGLRLFQTRDSDWIDIELLSLTDPDPGRAFLYQVRIKSGTGEKDMRRDMRDNRVGFYFPRILLECRRDLYVPDGILTLLFSVRPRKQSVWGTPNSGGDRTRVIPPHTMTIGELSSETTPSLYVKWTITRFFQLSPKSTRTLESPEFNFSGRRHRLRLIPSGKRVDIHLVNLSGSNPGRYASYELGLMSTTGEEIHIDRYRASTTRYFSISRSELDPKESACFPDGHLTVFCCVGSREPNSAGRTDEEGFPGNGIEHKTTNPDSASNITDKENPRDENVSSIDTKDDALLRERMKGMLTKGSDHDVTICVQDKEFRAHRNILSARSPVFAMMLSHDTKESNTGTINIEDCDPESFDEFLLYVYSGRTENLTPSNALHLYYTGDKYDFPLLKERCVNLLKTSLSITSICNVFLLAAKHQERELLEVATEFFARNIKKIIVTVGWQKFLSQNPVEANELYVKSLDILLPEN